MSVDANVLRRSLTTLILIGVVATFLVWLRRGSHSSSMLPMEIPPDNNALLSPPFIRTDFSDDEAWQSIRAGALEFPAELKDAFRMMAAMNAQDGENVPPCVHIIDDRNFADLTTEQVLERAPEDAHHACLFIVDRTAVSQPDHPILVVDLRQRGRSFRVIPTEVWGVASNLAIANMDWEDFANRVDVDGVFRGYSGGAQ
jgi:hypothetical protein